MIPQKLVICSPELSWFVTRESPCLNSFCFAPLVFIGWCIGACVNLISDLRVYVATVTTITVPGVVVITGIISISGSDGHL